MLPIGNHTAFGETHVRRPVAQADRFIDGLIFHLGEIGFRVCLGASIGISISLRIALQTPSKSFSNDRSIFARTVPLPPLDLGFDQSRHGVRVVDAGELELTGVGADHDVAESQRTRGQVGFDADRKQHAQWGLLAVVVDPDHLFVNHDALVGDDVIVVAPVDVTPDRQQAANSENQSPQPGPGASECQHQHCASR